MALNRDNFLRWSGSMVETVPVLVASDDGITMPQGQNYVEIDPFTNDTANLGIDPLSLVVTSVSDTSAPFPRWNEVTGKLRIYRPAVGTPPLLTVTYYFRDFLGNASNEASIVVALTLLTTGYRGYAPSRFCIQSSFGLNTGDQQYSTLEKYYPSLGTAFIPQDLKPNISTDADYIAPTTNTTFCPLPSTIPFIIYNNTSGPNTVTVTLLGLTLSPNPVTNYPVSVAPGASVQVMVPVGFYNSGTVTFTHTGTVTSIPWEYHYGPGGVGSITGTVGSGSTFTITAPPVNGAAVLLEIN